MTKQVALADRTYRRLRRSRHPDESFSDAIERLLDASPKQPWTFVGRGLSRRAANAWIKRTEADRDRETVLA